MLEQNDITIKTNIMSRNLDHQTIDFNGVRLTVSYTVSGKYYAQTHLEPAEYPETEIHEITAEDSNVNLFTLFSDNDIEEMERNVQSFLTY